MAQFSNGQLPSVKGFGAGDTVEREAKARSRMDRGVRVTVRGLHVLQGERWDVLERQRGMVGGTCAEGREGGERSGR